MEKMDMLSMTLEEWGSIIKQWKQPSFRAKQIFDWLHNKHITEIDDMTNIPKDLREKLKQYGDISGVKQIKKLISNIDSTTKYLFGIQNNLLIESVLMRYDYGNTVCISTQAGCRMGCRFCASTLDGVERNLTAGEMLSQIYEIQKDVGQRISGVVLMGSGEPLDNYDNVIRFIHLLNHEKGLHLGQRHITLSTCGIVDKIYDLLSENLQITLAVSLHASNDNIRQSIMPIAKKYSMEQICNVCKQYSDKTKRRITFEYALIKGVNDSESCAMELSEKLHDMLCHVNLIPVNDVKERNYSKSNEKQIQHFAQILQKRGIETTIRRKLGSDIDAACGQLRRSYQKDNVIL
ncbi:MAG: 23S rRNA (adenine(2503)-C(2))-methyltransferase RlmN [Firmicutes bacterium]|jgi:23S rRNA (adenine2503-C2)-methyltransferase|nr:23S rRNA (adenine(2503)-C(2))-methyltransferase RlmN [Bacillota bacterium]